jgi:hypothetical protein
MKISTMKEFKNFINELNLKNSWTRRSLYDMFIYKDREFIVGLKTQKVDLDGQTFYELYVETKSKYDEDTKVLIFETLEDLQKVEEFIRDNFKFLEKEKENETIKIKYKRKN